ncbi:UNVERIFIED_ORG: hypothetical protein GGD48_005497 [Rhizobium etli]
MGKRVRGLMRTAASARRGSRMTKVFGRCETKARSKSQQSTPHWKGFGTEPMEEVPNVIEDR